jgi:superfamily I DNA and RNA helicase
MGYDYKNRKISVGKQVRIERDIPSPDGMLYKHTIVKVDELGFPDKDMRVIDSLGKLWYVDYEDVSVGFL